MTRKRKPPDEIAERTLLDARVVGHTRASGTVTVAELSKALDETPKRIGNAIVRLMLSRKIVRVAEAGLPPHYDIAG